jgi:hypothetical protein
MDPQFNPPLTFAEQLRALQEHHSTCVVKITDGTLNGEIHLLNGNIVSSHFGVLDGQSAVDAVLAAGSNIEYVVSSRSETPNDDESMIVPVTTWHDSSADVTPVDFIRDDEVTRHLAMADHDANDPQAKDVRDVNVLDINEGDRKTPVSPTTQPGWGPKAAPTVPTGAFGTPRRRTRSGEGAGLSASGTHMIDPTEPTEPRVSKVPPALPPKEPATSSSSGWQRNLVAVLAVLFAIGLVLWARSSEQTTSTTTSAATDTSHEATPAPAREATPAAVADPAKPAKPSRTSSTSQAAVGQRS